MGIRDKLTDYLFFLKNKKVAVRAVKEDLRPKRKARVPLSVQIPPFYFEREEVNRKFLEPHEIYVPATPKETYFFNSDILKEQQIEKFNTNFTYISSSNNNQIDFEDQDQFINDSEEQNTKTDLPLEEFSASLTLDIKEVQPEKKKPFVIRFKAKPFSELVSRRTVMNSENLSFPFIIPTKEKQIKSLDKLVYGHFMNNKSRLLVEKGDFIADLNFQTLTRNKCFAIAMYKDEKIALTCSNNYVFRVKDEILDRDFLDLLIKDDKFDGKLSFLAYKISSQKNCISWNSLINDLWINIPSLNWQENVVKRNKRISELIEIKKSICDELDKLMDIYFHSLFDQETTTLKNFQELFSIDSEKIEKKATFKMQNFKKQNGRFIFSNIKELIIGGCQFDKLNRLFLYQKVCGDETQQYLLNLWLGSDEFSSFSNLYSINPKEALGIPYGYHLFKKNLNNLAKRLPSITSKRFVNKTELKSYEFEINSQESINAFNRVCWPILEYQQISEEEIYKLTKLLEGELKITCLRVLNKNLSK